jgi:hypothetical protein
MAGEAVRENRLTCRIKIEAWRYPAFPAEFSVPEEFIALDAGVDEGGDAFEIV